MIYHRFLEQTVSVLIDTYPFFGCLVHRCSINWTDKMPTAAVRVLPSGSLEMVVNPEFFCQLTPKERVGLVLHEMYHLTCDHMSLSFGLDPQIANIAMDTSINQHIPVDYLPPGALLPENVVHLENRVRKARGESLITLDPMQGFANYYNILKAEFDRQHIKQMQNPHPVDGPLDANNQPKPMTPEEQQKQKDQIKKSLQELLNKESELEQEKQNLLAKENLTPEEKTSLTEVIETQKTLVNTQNEIKSALAKMKDPEIDKLNDEVTKKLTDGQSVLEQTV